MRWPLPVRRPVPSAKPGSPVLLPWASVLMGAWLCFAAACWRAPVPVLPAVAVACVALPVFGRWELAGALRALRGGRDERAIARFRRSLDRLPEIEHPLDS